MKNLKQDIKSGVVIFLVILSLGAITVFAANWYDSLTSNAGDPLTATKWNNVVKATVPTGAIMAFNLTTCPDTWTEYLPARGRFLRGIDSTGVNDTVRTLGNLQSDAFQGHFHNVYDNVGGSTTSAYWYDGTQNGAMGAGYTRNTTINPMVMDGKRGIADGTNGTPRIATETRPKNVAVLFCEKL